MFDKASDKHDQAVKTYRVAWNAIAKLAPDEEFGRWKDVLRDLKQGDLRGPGPEEYELSASRYVPSWIWTTAPQTSTSTKDPDLDAALRVEWCKLQERAKRYAEEVELVVEEMRRTLVTLKLNASEWEKRAISPSLSVLEATTAIGVSAYAHKQATIHHQLVKVFIDDWYELLEKQPFATSWLEDYPCPPKNKRHRLACNVRLFHPGSLARPADTPHVGKTPPDGVGR